MPVVVCVAI